MEKRLEIRIWEQLITRAWPRFNISREVFELVWQRKFTPKLQAALTESWRRYTKHWDLHGYDLYLAVRAMGTPSFCHAKWWLLRLPPEVQTMIEREAKRIVLSDRPAPVDPWQRKIAETQAHLFCPPPGLIQ